MSLNPNVINDFKSAMTMINRLVNHLEEIENNFYPAAATEEERSLVKHLERIAYGEFNLAGHRLNQMFLPVIYQGRLRKNNRDKYEIPGWETSCGSFCEAYLPYRNDYDEGECMTWVPTSIEHDGKDYYFTARKNEPLEGAFVRIRG